MVAAEAVEHLWTALGTGAQTAMQLLSDVLALPPAPRTLGARRGVPRRPLAGQEDREGHPRPVPQGRRVRRGPGPGHRRLLRPDQARPDRRGRGQRGSTPSSRPRPRTRPRPPGVCASRTTASGPGRAPSRPGAGRRHPDHPGVGGQAVPRRPRPPGPQPAGSGAAFVGAPQDRRPELPDHRHVQRDPDQGLHPPGVHRPPGQARPRQGQKLGPLHRRHLEGMARHQPVHPPTRAPHGP